MRWLHIWLWRHIPRVSVEDVIRFQLRPPGPTSTRRYLLVSNLAHGVIFKLPVGARRPERKTA